MIAGLRTLSLNRPAKLKMFKTLFEPKNKEVNENSRVT